MNPEQNESQREFEKYMESEIPKRKDISDENYEALKNGHYETWQAACASTEKRLLMSRVSLPEKERIVEEVHSKEDKDFLEGYNAAVDAIKLIPPSSEFIDSLLPDYEEIKIASIKENASLRYDNKEKYCTNKDFVEARSNAFIRGAKYIREHVKSKLGL